MMDVREVKNDWQLGMKVVSRKQLEANFRKYGYFRSTSYEEGRSATD